MWRCGLHPVRDGNAPDSWLSSPVAVGGPDLRFHDLRRTAATLLLSQNVHPKIVADLLGHASVAMTLDPYRPPPPRWRGGSAATAIEPSCGASPSPRVDPVKGRLGVHRPTASHFPNSTRDVMDDNEGQLVPFPVGEIGGLGPPAPSLDQWPRQPPPRAASIDLDWRSPEARPQRRAQGRLWRTAHVSTMVSLIRIWTGARVRLR
ncbi:MAG: tyrosine-type recombinase/integrase [Candidatus Dormibacteria bacterium]